MAAFASFPFRVALIAGLLLATTTSGPLAQQRVGVNSAVNPEALGTPPGAQPRKLVIGQDVIYNEHITTGDTGQTQLLFLDESAMTVGPNSDLTIDQFVYDPKSGTGKLAMSATRGLLRYVGGKLSKQDDAVTLRTSTATLAVRGGAFIASISLNGPTDVVFIYGKGLTITGLTGGSQIITRPGFHSITSPGGSPSPPSPKPPGQLAGFTQLLDGMAGSTGGAPTMPTDLSVINSGIPQTISGNLGVSLQQSLLTQGGGTLFAPTTNTTTNMTQTTVPQPNLVVDCSVNGSCPTSTTVVGTTASGQPVSGASVAASSTSPPLPTSGGGASRTTQVLSGNFGGLMYTTAQPTPYIVTGGILVSTDAPNNRISATVSGSAQAPSAGVSTFTLQYGGLTGLPGGQVFIDDKIFAAAESQVNPQQIVIDGRTSQPTSKLNFASSGAGGAAGAPASLLPSGAAYCQCQYLQWGYWGGDINSTDSTGAARIDRGHTNTWIAGVATPLADLNTLASQSASGTYTGHAIGSVFNNGQSYIAAGGFTGTYNFGTQSGTWAVNNFDGRNFTATGRAPLTGANYAFTSTSSGLTGSVNGTFYGPRAAETGGSFAFKTTTGLPYLASGIYAGKQ